MSLWDRLHNYFSLLPATIIYRSLLLWLVYFSIGTTDSVRGPTLLDLRDLVGANTADMTYIFVVAAMGGLLGCFAAGAVLDRFQPAFSYLFLMFSGMTVAVCTMIVPFSPSLLVLLLNGGMFGFFNGCFHTCGNVLLLTVWRGRKSSSVFFALHFFYGAGALLAPILAKPFLKEDGEPLVPVALDGETFLVSNMREEIVSTIDQNITRLEDVPESVEAGLDFYTIKSLYPILGSQLVLVCLPFLYFYLKDSAAQGSPRCHQTSSPEAVQLREEAAEAGLLGKKHKLFLLALIACLYFLFSGMEVSFRSYISTFTVAVGHSRQTGSDVTALFYTSFAAVRLLLIAGGLFLSPTIILWTSLAFCLSGIGLLAFMALHSLLVLQLGVILMGGGSAALFATGILWLQEILPISNRIGAMLTISMNISAQIYSVIIGLIIEEEPMLFIYLTVLSSMLAVLVYLAANLLVYSIRRNNRKGSRLYVPDVTGSHL